MCGNNALEAAQEFQADIDFGLKPGGELKVETTIWHEIRQNREAVVINKVSEDEVWCEHVTPAMYGFQSYISMPIILADGSFFGTLCAIDPRPTRLNAPEPVGMFRLFAELIAKHLDADRALAASESALAEERAVSELREQFMARFGWGGHSPAAFESESILFTGRQWALRDPHAPPGSLPCLRPSGER